jgi:hypothetical protein
MRPISLSGRHPRPRRGGRNERPASDLLASDLLASDLLASDLLAATDTPMLIETIILPTGETMDAYPQKRRFHDVVTRLRAGRGASTLLNLGSDDIHARSNEAERSRENGRVG